MPTYIGENKIIDRYLGDKFLEAAYIGDKKVYDPYTEIVGYLPIIYKSRAAVALKNYRIYGTSEGAGVETENLVGFLDGSISFTGANTDLSVLTENGILIFNGYTTGEIYSNNPKWKSLNFYLDAGTYYITSPLPLGTGFGRVIKAMSDESILCGTTEFAFTLQERTEIFIAFYINNKTFDDAEVKMMLVEGSTAPDHYIPHGYKLPLTVESGAQSQDIPIYIGSSKLGEEEYVDYESGKVYKLSADLWDVNGTTTNQHGERRSGNELAAGASYIVYNNSSTIIYYRVGISTTVALSIQPNSKLEITPNDTLVIWLSASSMSYVAVKIASYVDPPVPLPPIPTYKGENTLSSTETLGEVTVKGRIKQPTYRQVEYLKSTGTQYIQTDIIPFNTTKIKLDMQFGDFHEYANASTYNSYFCGVAEFGGDTTSDAFWGVSLNELSGSTDFDFYLGNVSWQESANHISNPANITTRQTMQICRGSSYWGNQTALVNAAVTKAEPTEPLAIMGFNCVDRPNFSPNPYKCRNLIIYGATIYLNGSELSHNLLPVEREDGELGLLDTITNKFYANAGTGTFEKGDYI